MSQDIEPKGNSFEFKIDGEVLYAPRELMTIEELLQIAYDAKVLDPVEEGHSLEDDKGNSFALESIVDLGKTNVFFATENAPGPAS